MKKVVNILKYSFSLFYKIKLCSVITRGRVLNGELYAQIFQKLIYSHLFDLFIFIICIVNIVLFSMNLLSCHIVQTGIQNYT